MAVQRPVPDVELPAQRRPNAQSGSRLTALQVTVLGWY